MNENELKVLIDKMKVGDRESFNKLFRRYYTPLTRFCVRFVADGDHDARGLGDLVQELLDFRLFICILILFRFCVPAGIVIV